jgi:hypothetical protein
MASGAEASILSSMGATSHLDPQNGGSTRGRAAATVDLPPIPRPQASSTQEKLHRRESKLGLRSIFGRSKAAKQGDGPPSPRRVKGPIDSRHLETEISSTHFSSPYSKTVAMGHVTRPLSPTDEEPDNVPNSHVPGSHADKSGADQYQTKSSKADLPELPPLFKAYPQAVRYTTLPAPIATADSLIKAHEKKGNGDLSSVPAEHMLEKPRLRRKHRRTKSGPNSSDWTQNVYILTTSGWLLEYSCDGPFDRLPQKLLRLSKTSAAFASDLVPGRHWVLHVSSALGSDGTAAVTPQDSSRSFLSRLPFRGTHAAEKRNTSNMLLVFESAREMDGWLALLRGAIEAMGGRKSVSETGKPVQLREQTSPRTLVIRDSARYSQSSGHSELPWEQHLGRRGSDVTFAISDTAREQSMDELSATNSFISHDGLRLESLRNSQNRLSYVSSGQRTMITSTGSSPGGSPTMENFPGSLEEPPNRHLEVHSPDVKLRPNATAIIDRRQSLQTLSPLGHSETVDGEISPQNQRPRSTYAGAFVVPEPASPTGQSLAPNFSVPSNRRYSTNRMSYVDMDQRPQLDEIDATSRNGTRRPPTALRISRPLSMVADQPSPKEGIPDRPTTGHGDYPSQTKPGPQSPTSPTVSQAGSVTSSQNASVQKLPKNGSVYRSPRRLSSLGALRQSGDDATAMPALPDFTHSFGKTQGPERRYSSVGRYGRGDAFSTVPNRGTLKRSSMLPFGSDRATFLGEAIDPHSLPLPAPPPTVPLPPIPKSCIGQLKAIATTPGEPAAAPPTCALPPIPTTTSHEQ